MHQHFRRLAIALTLLSGEGAACGAQGPSNDEGRLSFKAHAPAAAVSTGKTPLGLATERDGFLAVPHDNAATHRQPLLILMAITNEDLIAHDCAHGGKLFQ